MINTVIFDLDGLLIDSEKTFFKIDKELLASFGYDFDLDDYIKNYCGKTGIANARRFCEKYALPLNEKEAYDLIFDKEKEYIRKGIPLHKGAKELLDYLKAHDYKILLATSSTKERALSILDSNHVRDYFDAMVFGPDVKNSKPAPDIFIKASELADEPKENCLVLEGSEAGIKAADAAGIKVICIPDLKKPSAEAIRQAEKVLDSLLEVIDYLKTQDK